MKKVFLLILFMMSFSSFAQILVKEGSFHKIDGFVMLDKSEHLDDNNVPMALIKISTENISAEQRRRITFKGNLATYFDVQFKSSEIYLYLSTTATFIEIHHPDFGKTEFWLPEDLCDYCGYEMVVVSNYFAGNDDSPKLTFNYLIISADQPDAAIYVNDEFISEKDASVTLDIGKEHTWRIECPFYHTESGKLIMTSGSPISIEKTLRPAFGYLNVITDPEQNATVYINNQKVGTSPYKSDKLISGNYTVRVTKEMFKPVEKIFAVTDNNTTDAIIDMSSNMVDVVIVCDDEAEIYADNVLLGKGTWNGKLSSGMHVFEAKRENYETTTMTKNLVIGENVEILLDEPKPICGMLDVNSIPIKANVYIDGKSCGITPMIVQDLLIGEHEIKFEKEGYNPITKKIIIEENQMFSVKETLTQKKIQSIVQTKMEKDVFVTLNYSYSFAPQSSIGLTYGQIRKFGWFVSAMTGFDFDALGAELECDEIGLIDGNMPFYSGEITSSRLSLTAGMMYKIANPLYIKLGAGYGMNVLAWETSDGQLVKNNGYSLNGIDIDAGIQLFYGKIAASVDFVTTNLQYSEIKIGMGIRF